MFGMLIGFKLINEPMLIYFSDPANPRPESWGALLLGVVFFLVYLKYKMDKDDFKIISRFATFGLIGGGLGFGLGGFWFILGSTLPKEVIFNSWWKSMEFTFGLLLGGSLGYATWLSRKKLILIQKTYKNEGAKLNFYSELGLTMLVGFLVYWIIPQSLEPFVDAASSNDGILMRSLITVAQILINYSFYGFIFIVVIMYIPKLAWQIGITLTFCHAAIDLVRDHFSEIQDNYPLTAGLIVILLTLLVALLTIYSQGQHNVKRSMFLLLAWSLMMISYVDFLITGRWEVSDLTFCEIFCRQYFVDMIFTISAIFVSWIAIKKIKETNRNVP